MENNANNSIEELDDVSMKEVTPTKVSLSVKVYTKVHSKLNDIHFTIDWPNTICFLLLLFVLITMEASKNNFVLTIIRLIAILAAAVIFFVPAVRRILFKKKAYTEYNKQLDKIIADNKEEAQRALNKGASTKKSKRRSKK